MHLCFFYLFFYNSYLILWTISLPYFYLSYKHIMKSFKQIIYYELILNHIIPFTNFAYLLEIWVSQWYNYYLFYLISDWITYKLPLFNLSIFFSTSSKCKTSCGYLSLTLPLPNGNVYCTSASNLITYFCIPLMLNMLPPHLVGVVCMICAKSFLNCLCVTF